MNLELTKLPEISSLKVTNRRPVFTSVFYARRPVLPVELTDIYFSRTKNKWAESANVRWKAEPLLPILFNTYYLVLDSLRR